MNTWQNGVRRPRQIRGPKIRANVPPKGPCWRHRVLSPWCGCRRLGSTLGSWRWQDINVGNPLWRWTLTGFSQRGKFFLWKIFLFQMYFSNMAAWIGYKKGAMKIGDTWNLILELHGRTFESMVHQLSITSTLKGKVASILTWGAICSANNSYVEYLVNSVARCSRVQIIVESR